MDFIDQKYILYQGTHCAIVHCSGAEQSLNVALEHVGKQKRGSLHRRLMQQMMRYADGDRLSSDNFPSEGKLPDKKKFYAFKKLPIRAYCWQSNICKRTLFISHYVFKDQKKLNSSDADQVGRNWEKKERRHEN